MSNGKLISGFNALPHNIQIELVEGCNRMCDYCGIYSIWKNVKDRSIKKMEYSLAKDIAYDLGKWFGAKRIEFAMHGEPTLHNKLTDIISIFRNHCEKAQLQLTTNGSLILKKGPDIIKTWFGQGLNLLIVDTYHKREELVAICGQSGIQVSDYYTEPFNCYQYHSHKIQQIIIMGDIGKMNGKKAARKIINHAGNINPNLAHKFGIQTIRQPLNKTCSRPFREITIHYDGSIPLCCIDWRHEFIVGKFPEDGSLHEIWNNDIFNIMRLFLQSKNRQFLPCYRCDYNGGFRLGLLPKVSTETDLKYLEELVKKNYNNYARFAHKNASTQKTFKSQNCQGIKKFLKENK